MAFRKTAAACVKDIGTSRRQRTRAEEWKWKCMTQTRGLKSEIENLKADAARWGEKYW